MPADDLVTLGASALAGMVLTPKAGIFHPASEELKMTITFLETNELMLYDFMDGWIIVIMIY